MLQLPSFLGRTLDGKYRLEALLGQGGMGAVFRATHLGTDRVVALKLIAPGLMDQDEFVQRFQREARATGRLRHPNIVDLTDFGFAEVDGQKLAYLVMEFLEGETLADLLKRNPTPPLPFVVEVVQQVCSALQEAHDAGIVHRDLKPDNLWLEPDRRGGQRVKILDFGLAKIYDPKARADGKPGLPMEDMATQALAPSLLLTEALPPERLASSAPTGGGPLETVVGTRLGTPAYMSPEQCRGVALDHHSDLYSLGVIVYQVLSGHPPFQGNSLELINQHIQSEVPSLREVRNDLPPGLAELVMECLSKDPGRRPGSAEVLGNALEGCAEGGLALLRRALALLLERWPEIWPIMWRVFLGPFLLLVVMFPVARYWELGMGPNLRAVVFSPVYAVVLAWGFAGFGLLKGRLGPLVLWHTLFPLRPLPKGVVFLSEIQRRAHRDWVLRNVALLFGLFLILPIMYLAASLNLPKRTMIIGVIGLEAVVWGLIGYWLWKARKIGGNASGLLPSVMYVEGLPPEEAGARITVMKAAIQAHQVEAGKILVEAGSAPLALAACLAALLVGFDALLHGASPDLPLGTYGFFLWNGLLLMPVWALLSTLDAILTALSYLRFRKLARESLRKAFDGLQARMEVVGR